MRSVLLRDLVEFSRDGEWGVAEPGPGLTAVRIVRGTDFDDFRVGDLSELPLRFVPQAKVDQKRLRAGDILIETAGGTATRPTGRTVLVRDSHLEASDIPLCCASFARFIRVDTRVAEPGFLYLWLDHAWQTRQLERFNTQHTGVARFQWGKCADSLSVPVPDLLAQRNIADAVLSFDKQIDNVRQRIEVLNRMTQAIYREWFVHLRYPGHKHSRLVDSALGAIPDGWRIARVADVAVVNRESRKPTADEQLHYLDISCLGDRRVGSLSAMVGATAPGRARRVVRQGDVVWSMVRPNRRAHAMLVDPADTWIASTGLAVLTPVAVSPSYLFETVSTSGFSDYLVSREGGAAYPAVKPKHFDDAKVLIPTRDVERAFDDIVSPQHRLIWNLRAETARLAAMRDLLLPRLLGRVVDMTASVA